MTATAYDRLLDRLHDLGKVVKTNGRPNQAKAQCPAHDDRHPSLSITGIEGQVLATATPAARSRLARRARHGQP